MCLTEITGEIQADKWLWPDWVVPQMADYMILNLLSREQELDPQVTESLPLG